MQVQIFSVLAAIGGSENGVVWNGDISPVLISNIEKISDQQVLDTLFRLFNRVDAHDIERLQAINYQLPSLSVGDFIAFKRENDEGFNVYRVVTMGFEKISGNADVIPGLLMGR